MSSARFAFFLLFLLIVGATAKGPGEGEAPEGEGGGEEGGAPAEGAESPKKEKPAEKEKPTEKKEKKGELVDKPLKEEMEEKRDVKKVAGTKKEHEKAEGVEAKKATTSDIHAVEGTHKEKEAPSVNIKEEFQKAEFVSEIFLLELLNRAINRMQQHNETASKDKDRIESVMAEVVPPNGHSPDSKLH